MSGINSEPPNTVLVTETGGVTVIVNAPAPDVAGQFIDPDICYLTTDGNDSTADGSPARPFLTFQAAIDDGANFTSFSFGEGSFGNGDFSARGALTDITLVGRGHSEIGTITGAQGFGVNVYASNISIASINTEGANGVGVGAAGTIGGDVVVYGDSLSSLGSIVANGGDGAAGDGGTVGGNGGAGGDILTVYGGIRVVSIETSGGAGGADGGAGAGSAGADGSINLESAFIITSLTPNSATVVASVIAGTFYAGPTYP